MGNEQSDDILTSKQVAELAKVTRKTVAEWAKRGKLTCIRLPGGDLRFRRSDVDELLSPTVEASA